MVQDTVEQYSAIKRNGIGSFVEMWMDLESIIQSEISQKQKKQIIYLHVCGIQKNGTGEPVSRARIETQMKRTDLQTQQGKGKVG